MLIICISLLSYSFYLLLFGYLIIQNTYSTIDKNAGLKGYLNSISGIIFIFVDNMYLPNFIKRVCCTVGNTAQPTVIIVAGVM